MKDLLMIIAIVIMVALTELGVTLLFIHATKQPTAPEGWQIVEAHGEWKDISPADGITVTIPGGWRKVDKKCSTCHITAKITILSQGMNVQSVDYYMVAK